MSTATRATTLNTDLGKNGLMLVQHLFYDLCFGFSYQITIITLRAQSPTIIRILWKAHWCATKWVQIWVSEAPRRGVDFAIWSSVISIFSKTNITPSFENYKLFTGIYCNFRGCTECKSSTFSPSRLCTYKYTAHGNYSLLPLLHTVNSPTFQRYLIVTAHWSFVINWSS